MKNKMHEEEDSTLVVLNVVVEDFNDKNRL